MKLAHLAVLLSIGCTKPPGLAVAPTPKPPAAYDAAELEILVDTAERAGVRLSSPGPQATRARVVFEVESATSAELEIDLGRFELDLVTQDDDAFHTISPDQTGLRTVKPWSRRTIDLSFELPPGVSPVPANVDAFRLRWSLGRRGTGQRLDRTTPFLVDPVTGRAYHTPFYDPIDDRANRRSYSHVDAPARSFVHQPLPYRTTARLSAGEPPAVAISLRRPGVGRAAPSGAFIAAAEPQSPERACEGIGYARRRTCPLESVRRSIRRIDHRRDGVVIRLSADAGDARDLGRWLECSRAMVRTGSMPPCSIDLDDLHLVVAPGTGGDVLVGLSAPGWPDVLGQRAVDLLRSSPAR